ncbi:MAG: hypothetical protein Q8M37_01920 [Nevskia sp.]|nr:hypothetical protein [Nevskia sp.]
MSILNTRHIAAISFAVTSLLTVSVVNADGDPRDSRKVQASSPQAERSETAPNTWMQTKFPWLQHTTACEVASPTADESVSPIASVSAWKAAKYPALQVSDRSTNAPLEVATHRQSNDSAHAWLRGKQAYLYATAPAQPVAELICAR